MSGVGLAPDAAMVTFPIDVFLPGADLEAARLLAERLRVGVQKLPTSVSGSVTISAGVADVSSSTSWRIALSSVVASSISPTLERIHAVSMGWSTKGEARA